MPIKSPIKSTALTTDMAVKCFGHRITADRFREDVAMESMARALFDKRLKDGESVNIHLRTLYGDSTIENIKEYLDGFKNAPAGTLEICSVVVRQDNSGTIVDRIEKELDFSGLYPMKDLIAGLRSQKTNALFYTDTQPNDKTPRSPFDNTKTFIVIENLTMIRWHMLCSLLKRFLGKWFSETPMTEAELRDMANGLQQDSPDTFLKAMQTYADSLDLRGMFIREALVDFDTRFEKERVKALEKEAQHIEKELDSYEQEMLRLMSRKDDLLATLWGYQNKTAPAEPVTMNYFLANKNLVLVGCTADNIEFYDFGWFDGWDPDKAKATFAKDHMSSWLEYNQHFGIPDADAKLLYKAIFLTEKVKVRLWSHMSLNLRGNGDRILNVYSGSDCPVEITNALPNPHHCYNSCPGGNRELINNAMRHRDVIGAIEQCICATKGINITEHASYQYFAKDLFDPERGEVIYVNELNKFMTTKDAIAWLKRNEEK